MKNINRKGVRESIAALIFSTVINTVWAFPIIAQTSQIPCFDTLSEADKLYGEDDRTAAENLYRQCKQPFTQQAITTYFPEPITDPEQLSPAGKVYWREVQQRLERNQTDRVFVPLNLLIEKHPAFVPAYEAIAKAFQSSERESEALDALEQAAVLFPNNAKIAEARATALRNAGKPLEASMASRLFAIVNPDSPERDRFVAMADDNLAAFKSDLRTEYISTGIAGIVGNVLLGGGNALDNIMSSAALASMLFEGEESTGTRLAAVEITQAQEANKLIDDPVVLEYVNTIGQDIAKQMGRDEFEYEFHVIDDESLNASALPGGKVFINTGAILAAKSEADLAGLIAHEVAHAVLSHGYQRLATDGLLSVAQQALPIGNLAGYASLGFSRENERQADILGTRAVVGYGYAADGLYDFFVTLNEQTGESPPEYLSTHPATPNRISYLEALIQQNGYNRYSYEGVEAHARIQARIRDLANQ